MKQASTISPQISLLTTSVGKKKRGGEGGNLRYVFIGMKNFKLLQHSTSSERMVAGKRQLSYTVWTFDWAADFAQEVKKQLSFERKIIIGIYAQWHWLFQVCFTVHFLYLSASSVLSALLLLFSWVGSTPSLPLQPDFIKRRMKGMPTLS